MKQKIDTLRTGHLTHTIDISYEPPVTLVKVRIYKLYVDVYTPKAKLNWDPKIILFHIKNISY